MPSKNLLRAGVFWTGTLIVVFISLDSGLDGDGVFNILILLGLWFFVWFYSKKKWPT